MTFARKCIILEFGDYTFKSGALLALLVTNLPKTCCISRDVTRILNFLNLES